MPQGALADADFDISAGSGAIGGEWKAATVANVTAVGDEDDRTVTFTLGAKDEIGSGATVVIHFPTTCLIKNPTEAGDYTLEVMTSVEDEWVESAVYEITEPVVGGGVYVYNSAGVLMDTFGGDAALNNCEDATEKWFDEDEYTIEVGPGTYELTSDIELDGDELTLVSADGADVTIIDAAGSGIIINAELVTFDGFTIEDAGTAVLVNGADAVVQNCVITDATDAGVALAAGGVDATISDNVIEDCADGIILEADATDGTIENNEITEASNEGGIVFEGGNVGNTITGNTISDNDTPGITFKAGGAASYDNVIEHNTISGNDHGIGINTDAQAPRTIWAASTVYALGDFVFPTTSTGFIYECTVVGTSGDTEPTWPITVGGIIGTTPKWTCRDMTFPIGLVIQGNDIADNDKDGIDIDSWTDSNVVCFNNITGFEFPYFGLDNDNGDDVDAAFNWWGSDDEDDVIDAISDPVTPTIGTVTYEPWLSDVAGAIFTGYSAAGASDELDAEEEAGVVIALDDVADRIKAGAYAANPEGEDPPDPAVAYFDVYIDIGATATVATVKLYVSGINPDMVAYAWSLDEDKWVECSAQTVSEFGGYVVVTIRVATATVPTVPELEDLSGTTFAVVQGPPADVNVPALEAPDYGAEDVGLNPTFAWGGVADADEYTLQVATNQFYVDAWEKVHLTHTVWRWDIALDYDTTYYWRVQAIEDSGESDWAESVFTTEAAPVAPPAPPAALYTCPTCGLSFDTPSELQAHWEAVHAPPAPAAPEPPPTTPAYIWVIIAVGAVLIIAVIALIVRTRRVV